MVLTQTDLVYALNDYHIVADGPLAFSFEHRCQRIRAHPGAFRHFDKSFGCPHGRLAHPLGMKIRAELLENG